MRLLRMTKQLGQRSCLLAEATYQRTIFELKFAYNATRLSAARTRCEKLTRRFDSKGYIGISKVKQRRINGKASILSILASVS